MKDQLISDSYRKLNQELHQSNESFGNGGDKWTLQIQAIAKGMEVVSILDYGCGKGRLGQALEKRGFKVQGYDPAVEQWSTYPEHSVDMVVCCDVLEHVEKEFMDATLDGLRNLSKKAFFAVVALRPSNKTLPNGDNAHITLFSAEKWMKELTHRFTGGERLFWRNQNKLLFKWTRKK